MSKLKLTDIISKGIMKVARNNAYVEERSIIAPASAALIHEPKAPASLLKKEVK